MYAIASIRHSTRIEQFNTSIQEENSSMMPRLFPVCDVLYTYCCSCL